MIGSSFYIMSMEEGRVFWDPSLPSQTPDDRRKIFTSKIETLAKLHSSSLKRSGSAISASPAIISRARSIAGPGNTGRPKPSTFRNSKSSAEWLPRPCRNRSAYRSSMATIASTT